MVTDKTILIKKLLGMAISLATLFAVLFGSLPFMSFMSFKQKENTLLNKLGESASGIKTAEASFVSACGSCCTTACGGNIGCGSANAACGLGSCGSAGGCGGCGK